MIILSPIESSGLKLVPHTIMFTIALRDEEAEAFRAWDVDLHRLRVKLSAAQFTFIKVALISNGFTLIDKKLKKTDNHITLELMERDLNTTKIATACSIIRRHLNWCLANME